MAVSADRTKLFYEWEKSLRGWDLYDYPVDPEPSFVPCLKNVVYAVYQAERTADDGRHETLLSRVSGLFKSKAPDQPKPELPEVRFPGPVALEPADEIVEFHLLLPQQYRSKQSLMQQIVLSLSFVKHPLSFEVIGNSEEITVVLACSSRDAPQVYDQLTAHAPDCVIDQTTGYLHSNFDNVGVQQVVDFGLEHEVMLPLVDESGEHDLLVGIMGALSRLQDDECAVLQILFRVASNQWANALVDSVTDMDGSDFFMDAPHLRRFVAKKADSPLCACVIRIAAHTSQHSRCRSLIQSIGSTILQFRGTSNSLIPLDNDYYPDNIHIQDVLDRSTHRAGMLLNVSELTILAHLPDASVRIAKLRRLTKYTKAAPEIVQGSGIYLGQNKHHGRINEVRVSEKHRMRHMHLIGSSGTGKSNLMLNMIVQDMQKGRGVGVLDPHGDLIDIILAHVPDDRIDDVIVFDPSDEQYPIGFNIIDAHSELEKTLLASDLTAIFRRLSTSWGDQMNSVLANGIAAMLESTEGGTLPTLRRFLVDQHFRKEFLTTVTDPENVFYWEREFPLLSGKPQAPVLTRLDAFLRPKPIRHMVAQQDNKIDFSEIMQGTKIFLAKLSQGTIGTENSYLMGAFLVSKLNQIAYSRQSLEQSKRQPFFLYIDEFHNFVTPSMESILSGARKFNLSLILAHQEMRQVESRDQNVSSSVTANPYTRVCFRLGDSDAKKLQSGFSSFDVQDLQSLGLGEAIVRVERAEYDFNLSTELLPEVDKQEAQERTDTIIRLSQQKYGVPKCEVDQLIHDSIGVSDSKVASTKTGAVNEPVSTPKLRGRGGRKHKEIQQQVKQLAEKHGFKATVEKALSDGSGHVDVALERDGIKFACEISVTTSVDHEVENIKKCLVAGYDQVLCIADKPDNLKLLKNKIASHENAGAVSFIPVQLVERYFEGVEGKQAEKIMGYDVHVEYSE